MSNETEVAASESSAPVKTAEKARKPKPRKPIAKKVVKKSADPSPITKPQARILRALAKLKDGTSLGHAQIAARASVAKSWVSGHTFKACKANTVGSLVEQGFAKAVEADVDGRTETRAVATASGRKLLDRLDK